MSRDEKDDVTPALFGVPAMNNDHAIETAAEETIEALRGAGALDATHSLKIQLIRSGAKALDRELAGQKITVAATTLFSKVLDIADSLPTVAQAINDTFERMVKAMSADVPAKPEYTEPS